MLHVATPSLLGLELIKQYQGLSLEKYQDADGLWVVDRGLRAFDSRPGTF